MRKVPQNNKGQYWFNVKKTFKKPEVKKENILHPYFHTREEILFVSLMYVLLSIGLLKHIHLHVHTHMYTHLHTQLGICCMSFCKLICSLSVCEHSLVSLLWISLLFVIDCVYYNSFNYYFIDDHLERV